ncbi:HIT family protein [Jeongeupia chitinilytica]|uniref:HIT domain-containing protein n=1 Tax=Jeongeupia chitinilytica TaxID=1041641 RepID=A0ABQ3H188_9NEIS|nr:HIT family protein [Jeongeupia chitinilytica]GHD61326.1 HIT domain-containing protein [Jeongeupia chitinilytica]
MERDCVFCRETGGELLWQNELCRVVLADEPDYPGLCRVILRQHVAEMTDLPPADRQRLMAVVFAVEAAQRTVLSPDKINIASLGNVVPHLHWHIIPRWHDDATFPAPVWASPARPGARHHVSADTLARLRLALQHIELEAVQRLP